MADQADELALADREVEVADDHRLAAARLREHLGQVRDLQVLRVALHAASTCEDAFARATGAAALSAPLRRPGPSKYSMTWITIGFLGAPSRPIVHAIGMPVSMCVAWMSPFDSESRIAAQLAPFTTVELMPYFLNSPFSCAITMGEFVGQRDDAEAHVRHFGRRVRRAPAGARAQQAHAPEQCRRATDELTP
jgi:hypothetical protein